MVQASGDQERTQALIVKAFESISYLSVTDKSQRGKPDKENEKVQALIKTKGKDYSSDAKKSPPEVKKVDGKTAATEDGFEGMKVGDQKTGKAKQWHKDGTFFDGFMLNDEFRRGRFYFTNGDFYQGYFKDGKLDKGNYTMADGVKATFVQEA